jgi:hemerythrin superfamily protein
LIEEQKISNSETETVIKFKKIIEGLLTAKIEMKLTDIGYKIKEQTGQKVTNTILKNIIKSMNNVEVIPKKSPETARQVTKQVTKQDLFNNKI